MRSKTFKYIVRVGSRSFAVKGLIWPPDRMYKDIPTENIVDYDILDVEQVSGDPWSNDPRIKGDGNFDDFLQLNYNQFERGILQSFAQEAR